MSSSFKAYGKVNEADQERLVACRKTRRRITIITLSSIILVAVIVAAVVGTTTSSGGNSRNSAGDNAGNSISTSVKAVCDVTLYPNTCYDSLSPMVKSSQVKPQDLFKISMEVALNELNKISQSFSSLNVDYLKGVAADELSARALKDCYELLDLAMDNLNNSLSAGIDNVDDLKTWLSAAGTYQQTCINGFENENETIRSRVHELLKNSTEFSSNSLAIITEISKLTGAISSRRLMSLPEEDDKVPKWLSARKDRKLLQSSSTLKRKADIVVAKDGSGKYKTITEALKAVPDKSKKRFVIYVKKGVYYENVRVEKPKWNVWMIGDGMNITVVSGKLNFVDGTPTFSTATFAVFGKGFVAREMGFTNTAGAIKHQAVALMSSADQTIFYRCGIDGFQDSLYAHSLRQFYRECDIYGTVDFIFGNSAVVLQNCNIRPKKPMPGQQNTITAQGKNDPNQNTGIVIQNCSILPAADLSSVRTYLGRPWKNYSTTVYMHSMMGSLIDPAGWLPWTGTTAPDTIFYSEFRNSGPGSSTKNRVKWKGLRNITQKQAEKFTVKSFIDGSKWVSDAGVSFKPGL